jgi:thymidylate synthase (FAD)
MTSYPRKNLLGDGFVELLDVMGDDLTVVNAARVSFHKESSTLTDRDAKLVKYLADHHHVTPFFHPQIRLRIKMPIFVAREWYRHQIGFARNEVSRRYVDELPTCYLPDVVRARDANLKQGSKSEGVEENDAVRKLIENANTSACNLYSTLLEKGVAPEVARTVLPQGMFTEYIETGSLAAYARLCGLRCDSAAQWEIRQYAQAVSDLISGLFPVSWEALQPSHAATPQ